MFRSRNTNPLLFKFRKPTKMAIHSWFVFFSFAAIWLNSEGKIIDYKIIRPFTKSAKPKKPFLSLVEIPLNNENKKILSFLDGKKSLNTRLH
jgi:uncharacterized membrane protein (UPF0127 family)